MVSASLYLDRLRAERRTLLVLQIVTAGNSSSDLAKISIFRKHFQRAKIEKTRSLALLIQNENNSSWTLVSLVLQYPPLRNGQTLNLKNLASKYNRLDNNVESMDFGHPFFILN